MSYPFDQSGFPYGVSQPALDLSFIETQDPLSAGPSTFSDKGIYLFRFLVPAPVTFNTVSFFIGSTSSGNVDGGVYEKTTGGFSLMGSAGSTASGATNAVQNLTLDPAVALTPGTVYYLAFASDDGDVSVLCNSGGVAAALAFADRYLYKSGVFPLPTTLAAAADSNAIAPWFVLRNV